MTTQITTSTTTILLVISVQCTNPASSNKNMKVKPKFSKVDIGTTLSFSCVQHYDLIGSEEITCTNDNNKAVLKDIPTCQQRKYYYIYSLKIYQPVSSVSTTTYTP